MSQFIPKFRIFIKWFQSLFIDFIQIKHYNQSRMDHHNESALLLASVLEDLETFIFLKRNQNLIHSLLQIKIYSRKNKLSQHRSFDKISNASLSKKETLSRKSSASKASFSRSKSPESHSSLDIIQGAQNFNETRRKGLKQKMYTEAFQHANELLSYHQQEVGRFSNPFPFEQKQSVRPHFVPKLVELMSSQQISDIQQPFGVNNSRNRKAANVKNYQQSIAEVDDDDDEFQDIILSRLDKIQQKVNQMLREKKMNKLSTVRPSSFANPQRPKNYTLQNVGSGQNIIYSNQVQTRQFYKHNQPTYNKSANHILSPRVYTFHNTKNNSMYPSSKKLITVNTKQHLTERINNPSKFIHQNYLTDNEHPLQKRKINRLDLIQNSSRQEVSEERNQILQKNKTLGHYRQSQDGIQQNDLVERLPNLQKLQKNNEAGIDFDKIKKTPLDSSSAFKYIPISKLKQQRNEQTKYQNVQQKTERQFNRNQAQVRYGVDQNFNKYQEPVQERYSSELQENYSEKLKNLMREKNIKYRSGKDSGVRDNRLEKSQMKAYTEQDNADSYDKLSVSSQKHLYSQIQQLRQIARIHGMERRKNIENHYDQNLNSQNFDYRYHQKTQRPKYSSYRNEHNRREQQHMVVQDRRQQNYPEERVFSSIRQENYPQNQNGQNIEYVSYARQQLPRHQYEGQRPVYSVNQRPVQIIRQKASQVVTSQRPGQEMKQTVLSQYQAHYVQQKQPSERYYQQMSQEKICLRKNSTGSLNSFQSIPYYKMQTPSRQYISKQHSAELGDEKPESIGKIGNKSNY